MINKETIDQLSDMQNIVNEKIMNSDITAFKLKDVDFDDNGGFSVNGDKLSQSAISKIASTMNVTGKFFEYKKKMPKSEWIEMQSKLKDLNGNIEFVGKRNLNNDGSTDINKLYKKSEYDKGHSGSNITDINTYFEMIKSSLLGSSRKIKLSNSRFDEINEKVFLNLVDEQSDFSAFGMTSDMWRKGANFTFDSITFNASPFFQRLICTNGMVDSQSGYKTNIQNKSFNKNDIQKQINKFLVTGDDLRDYVKSSITKLSETNISIDEFQKFENMIRNWGDTGHSSNRYNKILKKVFRYDELNKAYNGHKINEKSSNWLKTADAGRNAYDFFNDMTYIASHNIQSGLSDHHAQRLQEEASKLLFKENLDLSDIAPKVDISVSKVIADPTNHTN